MLAEMPVAALSLNELSRRVGLAKSNVLRYFESREAVLLELLDAAWREWLVALEDALPAGKTAGPGAHPDEQGAGAPPPAPGGPPQLFGPGRGAGGGPGPKLSPRGAPRF